jgi:cathepsin X
MECTAMNTCLNCDHDPDVGCFPVPEGEYPTVKVTEYGSVKGDANIMAEIMNHGPVSCYLNAECIEDYTGGVNMYDTCAAKTINHAIQINGWGVDENGTDYWIGRNSWGTYWGERGFFRIVRGGRYDLQTCYWATPDLTGY